MEPPFGVAGRRPGERRTGDAPRLLGFMFVTFVSLASVIVPAISAPPRALREPRLCALCPPRASRRPIAQNWKLIPASIFRVPVTVVGRPKKGDVRTPL